MEHKKSKRIGPLEVSILVAALFLLVCGVHQIGSWMTPKPVHVPTPTELVVQDGREYQVLSFASIKCDRMPCYLITFAYPEEVANIASGKIVKELSRGTIIVPKAHIQIDRERLGRNRITWDPKVTVEGKEYKTTRWYPGHMLQADEMPQIRQERPLIRPKR